MSYSDTNQDLNEVNEAAVMYYLDHTDVDLATLDALRERSFFNEATLAEWGNRHRSRSGL